MNVDDLFNLIGRQQAEIYNLQRTLAALRQSGQEHDEQYHNDDQQAEEDDS